VAVPSSIQGGDERVRRITLIGDSIRMGYQAFVRAELEDAAELWWPQENGGTSQNILEHLEAWVLAREPGLVHINCGLHDLRKAFGAAEAAVPLSQYRTNVETMLRRILARGGMKVIWATTTPVNEQWHHQRKGLDRFEADVEAYNREAAEVARRLGVAINDLFAVVMRAGRDRYLQEDGVHFTEAGYRLLGETVAEAVRAQR
jgi:lysophospholipase L1-like esterase